MIARYKNNPLIRPRDLKPSRPDFEVMCAFNPGATLMDGKTVLLLRVAERPVPEADFVSTAIMDPERPGKLKVMRIRRGDPALSEDDPRAFSWKGQVWLTSISHLRLAVSDDGRNFTVSDKASLAPEHPWEEFGVEDPRIIRLDGWYWITYSAISRQGVATALARTRDFRSFEKLGIIFPPDNKDIAIFPERVGGRFWCFHRPMVRQLGTPSIWLASSPDLFDWGGHRLLIGPRPGKWDSERVGCGAQPIRTDEGWLQIYHASDEKICYRSGALLLAMDDPARIIARSEEPILSPEASYETAGFMPNVIFNNGLVERGNGKVDLYYGSADEMTAVATMDVAGVLETLRTKKKKKSPAKSKRR